MQTAAGKSIIDANMMFGNAWIIHLHCTDVKEENMLEDKATPLKGCGPAFMALAQAGFAN